MSKDRDKKSQADTTDRQCCDSDANRCNCDCHKPQAKDMIVESAHQAQIGGQTVDYTVNAGRMLLYREKNDDGVYKGSQPRAQMFFVAYNRKTKTAAESKKRPIFFAYNGGPGSSSVWLHMGMLGPKRVKMDAEGMPLPPPYQMIDNQASILDHCDIVFIDPVSTGYSRPLNDQKAEDFHGYTNDIESVGDFIYQYTSRYGRWQSPKYLIGESYGTTRSAGLSGYLQERYGMYLNGMVLVSAILNFATASFEPGNDLPNILFLPTYTASAWYHNKLDARLQKDLRATLDEAEQFATGEYAQALMKGNKLSDDEYQKTAEKVAAYTGLCVDHVKVSNLRINIHRFTKELLRMEHKTIGRIDSRYTGADYDAAGEQPEYDPSIAAIIGPYAACLNDYLRADLGVTIDDIPYEVMKSLYATWKYQDKTFGKGGHLNVAETMRKAMNMNRDLKVLVTNGYYDLATPYFATEYTFDHINLDKQLQKNISMTYYDAGHMIYVKESCLDQLKTDIIDFLKKA